MSGAPPAAPVLAERFRAAMGRWATGVSVVTAHDRGEDAGMTVNALLSVSLEPPTVLVSLQREVDTLPVLRRARKFGVSFLAAGQRELSRRFALPVPAAEKFRGVGYHRGPDGVPLLDGALAGLDCRLLSETPVVDHVLVVGEVVRLEEGPDGPPLLFYRGGYAEPEDPERLRLPRRRA
jgi:3-hydroxy-9,10-secoandrosta-1,3,5(10)-triene-9,17-dione monooxygenase reductase component